MALTVQEIKDLIYQKYDHYSLALESNVYNDLNKQALKFDHMQDSLHILEESETGELESVPLLRVISRIKATGPIDPGNNEPIISVNEQIENLITKAAAPGGGLHLYEKKLGSKLRGADYFTKRAISIEQDEQGVYFLNDQSVDRNTEHKLGFNKEHGYQDNKFLLFFAKLFSNKENAAKIQAEYDNYQRQKNSIRNAIDKEGELLFTPSETKRREVEAQLHSKDTGLIKNNRAKYNTYNVKGSNIAPEENKLGNDPDALYATEQAIKNANSPEEERKFRDDLSALKTIANKQLYQNPDFIEKKDQAEKDISLIKKSEAVNVFSEKRFNVLALDYSEKAKSIYSLYGIKNEEIHQVYSGDGTREEESKSKMHRFYETGRLLNQNYDALRFGCVMSDMLTKGSEINTIVNENGGNLFAIPLGILKVDIDGEYDKDIAKFLPTVVNRAAEISNDVITAYKNNDFEPLAKVLDANITVCNSLMKGMSPEDIRTKPEQLEYIANILRFASSLYNNEPAIFEMSKLDKTEHEIANGWANIGNKMKDLHTYKNIICEDAERDFRDKNDPDDHKFPQYQPLAYDKTIKMVRNYLAQSQELTISSNAECKNAIDKVSRQGGGIWNSTNVNCVIASKAPNNSFIEKIGREGLNIDNGITNKKAEEYNAFEVLNLLANEKYSIETDQSPLSQMLSTELEKQSAEMRKTDVKQTETVSKKVHEKDAHMF